MPIACHNFNEMLAISSFQGMYKTKIIYSTNVCLVRLDMLQTNLQPLARFKAGWPVLKQSSNICILCTCVRVYMCIVHHPCMLSANSSVCSCYFLILYTTIIIGNHCIALYNFMTACQSTGPHAVEAINCSVQFYTVTVLRPPADIGFPHWQCG